MNNDYKQQPSGWYAPLTQERQETAPAAEPAPKKKKGMPMGLRIVLGTLLVVGLIAGSSLLFGKKEAAPTIQFPDFGQMLPEETLPSEDELPEDWKDFFDSFYTTEDSSHEEPKLPEVEKRPAWQMELVPAGEEEMTLQESYKSCVDSIVAIRCFVEGELGYYWGTGIVMSRDGLIVTNAHMIEGCTSAVVILQDDTEFEAELVGYDMRSDLAVLKIDAKGLRPAVFGESDALTVGDSVAAIGNPVGEELRSTLTNGIVSAISRGMSYDGHNISLIQTNTAINEGNSGGALVNMYGQVVGVTNMKLMSGFSSIEGIGFAIPSATVCNVVNSLIREGKVVGRPAVGITVGAIADFAAEHYALPEGLYVSAVTEGTDAWEKGIRVGDIITAVNGEPARSTDDILKVRDGLSVGDTIRFSIWRDGESFDADVAMVEYNDVYK